MIALTELWLPILLSAVFVFIVSSIIHMVLPIHKSECAKLPNEPKLIDALRSQNVAPGEYMFPRAASMKDMGSPEMLEKFRQGPVGALVVMPTGVPNIGKSLIQWFIYSILVSIFTGYVATLGLQHGERYLEVFQIAGATAVSIYAFAPVSNSIWKGVPWGTTVKYVFDGIVYGLVTGGTFGWLWPK